MATNNLSFSAQVNEWVKQTEQRTDAVFRESTQRVVSKAQQSVPVDTGFLRASVRASLKAMPPIDTTATRVAGKTFGYDPGQITLTIAQAKAGVDVIYVGWTANYAAFVEYGTSRMAPRAYVQRAAMLWPSIVNQVAQEARARSGS